MATVKPQNIQRPARLLWRYAKPWRAALAGVALCAALSAAATVVGTYLLKPLVNNYILPGDMPGLARTLVYMAAMYITGAVCALIYTQGMIHIAQRMVQSMRDDLFSTLQTLPAAFFDTHSHGELMSRFTNDIDTLSEVLNTSFTALVQSIVTITVTFTLMLVLDYKLSALILASFIGTFFFLRFASRKGHRFFSQQQKQLAAMSGFAEEMITGQRVVRVFNHEPQNMQDFLRHNEALRKTGVSAATYSGMMIPVMVSISYLNYAVAACLGVLMAVSGALDIGTLTAYLIFVRQTGMPLNQISMQMNAVLAALAGAEHLLEVIAQPPEADDGTATLVRGEYTGDAFHETPAGSRHAFKRPRSGGDEYVPLKGAVVFHNVSFGYHAGQTVLDNISLYAKPGQRIALVGSTGAGKTTIASLLTRFYELKSGYITYDSIRLTDIRKESLRRAISVVLQDTHLFSGSIMDNIRFGNLEASDEEIIAAAKLAGADSFIRRMPQGYATRITGDGGALSAGQRQLLSIARAAASGPPVLILDEATSSIDTYTEKLVEQGMARLMQGRTVFVIAHRLSTVRSADAILVLEQGSIIERGTHDELVAQKGRYYQLYTGQFELS